MHTLTGRILAAVALCVLVFVPRNLAARDDGRFANSPLKAWFDKLAPASEDEEDMLDLAFGLGKSRAVLGQAAEAAAALRRAVDLDPKHPLARRMLARALECSRCRSPPGPPAARSSTNRSWVSG